MRKILFIIVPFFLFIYSVKAIYADFSIGIYPELIESELKPGTVFSKEILVKNNSTQEILLSVEYRPFKPAKMSDGKVTWLKSIPEEYKTLFERMQLLEKDNEITTLHVAPLETKPVVLKISTDERIKKQDYYFSVLFISKNNNKYQNSSSIIDPGIGTNILLTFEQSKQIVLKDFSTKAFFSSGPVPFNILLSNNEESLSHIKGEVKIRNMFGQVVGKIQIDDTIILSESDRYITKKKNVSRPEDINWSEKFLLGVYKSDLFININSEGLKKIGSVYFAAAPITVLVIIGLVLSLFISLCLRIKRKL